MDRQTTLRIDFYCLVKLTSRRFTSTSDSNTRRVLSKPPWRETTKLHAARDPGLFVSAPVDAHDALSELEHWWKLPVEKYSLASQLIS